MKKNLIAGIAAATFVGAPAFAADLPVKAPVYVAPTMASWTGFYVGGSVGYGWDSSSVDIRPDTTRAPFIVLPNKVPSMIPTDPKGWLGGGQLGFNNQIAKAIIGIETDFSLADISGNRSVMTSGVVPGSSFLTSAEQRLKDFGTVRGRLGITPIESLLVYGTGGLAWGRVANSGNVLRNPLNINFPVSDSAIKAGWTVGGGVELALNNKWSVKGEYLYYDLGKTSVTGSSTSIFSSATVGYDFETRGNIVRVGLNYRFGGDPWGKSPVVAKY